MKLPQKAHFCFRCLCSARSQAALCCTKWCIWPDFVLVIVGLGGVLTRAAALPQLVHTLIWIPQPQQVVKPQGPRVKFTKGSWWLLAFGKCLCSCQCCAWHCWETVLPASCSRSRRVLVEGGLCGWPWQAHDSSVCTVHVTVHWGATAGAAAAYAWRALCTKACDPP